MEAPPGGRLLSTAASHERYGGMATAHPAYMLSLSSLCTVELELDSVTKAETEASERGERKEKGTTEAKKGLEHARRAAKFCRMALNLDPGNWANTANCATVLERIGDPAGAIDVLKMFMIPGRGNANKEIMAEFRVRLGLLFLGIGENEDAGRWLEKAVERTPHDAHAQIALAIIRMRQGDLVAAKRHADEAHQLMPEAPMVAINYPHIMQAVKKHGLVGKGRGLAQDYTAATRVAGGEQENAVNYADKKDEL